MHVEALNWDDVRIFLAVARHKTLNNAAIRLAINPTTVARRLSRLEAAVSQRLFEHSHKGHLLTPAGQALLLNAQQMESAVFSAASGDPQATKSAEGVIRLSVSEGFGNGVLAPRLYDFSQRYPGISIELVSSTGFLNPSRREADVSIMLARPQKGPLIVRKLTDYRLGLYAARDYAGASAISAIADLYGQPLIGYISDLIYAPELRYLDEVDPGLETRLSSTSIIAQARLIQSAAGIGILPCFIGGARPDLMRLLPNIIDIERNFWLVMHRDVQHMTRIRLFIDWLVNLVEHNPLMLGRAAISPNKDQ